MLVVIVIAIVAVLAGVFIAAKGPINTISTAKTMKVKGRASAIRTSWSMKSFADQVV